MKTGSMASALAAIAVLFAATDVRAGFNVNVVQVSSYQGATATKYVWVTNGVGSGCPGAALSYDGSGEGGRALYSLLLSALLSGRPVAINVSGAPVATPIGTSGSGCTLLEAYIR